jgi:hypothetical protein
VGDPRKSKKSHLTYRDLFNPNLSQIYLEDLRKMISKEWQIFKNIFDGDQERFNSNLKAVNEYRADTHAKKIRLHRI